MNKMLQRALMAYRPLYLHGLWLDGRCALPDAKPEDPRGAPRVRPRILLVALDYLIVHHRSK